MEKGTRIRKMRIVATGVQKNGQPVTKDILESVVRNFNSDARPPVTLGHPEKGACKIAALGRASHLRTESFVEDGTSKIGLFGEVNYTSELEKLEDSGAFEGFSAGIYPVPDKPGEYYMHHLASLGQLPPAAETKTLDVVTLSSTSPEDCIILTAHMGNEKESTTMDKTEIAKLIADGIKAGIEKAMPTAVESELKKQKTDLDKNKNLDDKSDAGKPDDKGESLGNPQVKVLQENLANDRKDTLTELAATREMDEALDKSIAVMIDTAETIELCAIGENSRYKQLKNMIIALPKKGSIQSNEPQTASELLKSLELSDTGEAHKGASFDSTKW